MLQSSNIRRVVKDDGSLCSLASYAITLPAHKCLASMDAIKALGVLVFPMGVEGNLGGGMRRRGVRLQFFGTAADNATVTGVRIYASHKVEGGARQLILIGTAVVTLGNIAGGSGLAIGSGEFGADTITWTEDDFYTKLRTALAIPAAQIPTQVNDNLQSLLLADLGGPAELVFDVDLGTATGLGVLAESFT